MSNLSESGKMNVSTKSGGKKRKSSLSDLDAAEVERRRAISRRSSQRHRQREKIEVDEYKRRKDSLEGANAALKQENARFRDAIKALKASAAAGAGAGAAVASRRNLNSPVRDPVSPVPVAMAPFPGRAAVAVAVAAAAASAPATRDNNSALASALLDQDLAALLMRKQAPAPTVSFAAAVPHDSSSSSSKTLLEALLRKQHSPVTATSMATNSITNTNTNTNISVVNGGHGGHGLNGASTAFLLELWALKQQIQQNQQNCQTRPTPAPAPVANRYNNLTLEQFRAYALLDQNSSNALVAAVPSAAATSTCATNISTEALLNELMVRTARNPQAHRTLQHVLSLRSNSI